VNLTLTNEASSSVPIMSADGEGFADVLEPGTPYSANVEDAQVIIIGNKPSVTEQITQGVQTIAKTVKAIVAKWQGNNNAQPHTTDANVAVAIKNDGEKNVRVILGDGVNELTVAAGEEVHATAWGYLELREMGNVQADPNQHEAA
jgi:CTP:molybdopterin cytidylyltransferase MocA